MECEKCEYHYIKKGIKSKDIFNPLLDSIQTIEADKDYHMCGEEPKAVFLDDNRPKCSKFMEVKDEG